MCAIPPRLADDALLLAPVAEAIVSCSLRSRGVADALAALPPAQLQRLVQHLAAAAPPPVPSASAPATAAAVAAAASSAAQQQAAVTLALSMLRLAGSLVAHPAALPALLGQGGMLGVLPQLLPRPPTLSTKPSSEASTTAPPTKPQAAGPSDGTATATTAAAAAANSGLHMQALNLLLSLSQHPQLQAPLAAAGAAQRLVQLISHSSTPPATAEVAAACLANLAQGPAAAQSRLLAAGAVPPLVALLSTPAHAAAPPQPAGQQQQQPPPQQQQQALVCQAVDALANLCMGSVAAQRQVSAAAHPAPTHSLAVRGRGGRV